MFLSIHATKPNGIVDFALVGIAFTYGFRDWLYPLIESIEQTTAWIGARKIGCCKQLKQAICEYERTEALYVLLAILDSVGRGEDIPGYLYKTLSSGAKFLPSAVEPTMDESILDLRSLLSNIDSAECIPVLQDSF